MKIFLLSADNIIVNTFKNTFNDFYFLNDWEDADFRIPDFAPELIVINEDLLDEEAESRLEKVATQIPVVYLLPEGRKGERPNALILEKPFRFEALREQMDEVLTQYQNH